MVAAVGAGFEPGFSGSSSSRRRRRRCRYCYNSK